jgi:hypothetical protein
MSYVDRIFERNGNNIMKYKKKIEGDRGILSSAGGWDLGSAFKQVKFFIPLE